MLPMGHDYGDKVETIKSIVMSNYAVEEVYYEAGVLSFRVAEWREKDTFKSVFKMLREIGFVPLASKRDGAITIRVYPFNPRPSKKTIVPLLLFVATLVAVSVDGFFRSISPIYEELLGSLSPTTTLVNTLLFVAGLLGIIGIHEMGHKISAKTDGISSTAPYFIPGIPAVWPTFGAVIFQKEPIVNKDDMFDIGISGPLAGFLTSLAVLAVAFLTAHWMPTSEYEAFVEDMVREGRGVVLVAPLAFAIMGQIFQKPGYTPFFMPIGFAAWIGLVVTAINLFPVWQLDGGRIFRSFLTRRQHIISSYLSILVLFLAGYTFFAILLLFLMPRSPDVPPLDQISPLSKARKLAIAGMLAMFIVSFVTIEPSPLSMILSALS